MCIEDPRHRKIIVGHMLENLVDGIGTRASVFRIEIPDRIDDRRRLCVGIHHQILDAARIRLVEADNLR